MSWSPRSPGRSGRQKKRLRIRKVKQKRVANTSEVPKTTIPLVVQSSFRAPQRRDAEVTPKTYATYTGGPLSDRHARSPKATQRSPIAKKEERILLSQRSNYRSGLSSKPKFGSTTRDSSNGRRTENKGKILEMSFASPRGESKLDPSLR